MNTSLKITLLSCAILGFRHGLDYDHIAAITDITSVQKRVSASMRLGIAYALGHAGMIAILGALVILFQLSLPHRLDSTAERLVGLTLIILALYIVGSLWANPTGLPPSRAALLIRGYRNLRRVSRVRVLGAGRDESTKNGDLDYTGPVAFGVGMVHGLGAETPSQLALFLLAANLGGVGRGIAGMGMFLAGLLAMNTLMTASASGLFQGARPHPRAMRLVVGFTAAYSFIVGCIFLLGASAHLPSLS